MSKIGLGIFLAAACWLSSAAQAGQFTSVKVSGARNTGATAVNASGTVTGFYSLSAKKVAGFMRAPNGVMTTFSVPGLESTIPAAINRKGWIAGYSGEELSFVLKPDLTYATFQVPGARYTTATAINAQGYISGTYNNPDHTSGSFLRAPDGTISLVSASADAATSVYGLNDDNVMVGQLGFGEAPRGFVYRDGNVTTLDAATSVRAVNNRDWIAGVTLNDGEPSRGFTQRPGGRLKHFGPHVHDVEIARIDDDGNVSGTYIDRHSIFRGFVYSRTGLFTRIDEPEAGRGQPFAGTTVTGANDSGMVVGIYASDAYRNTAFIWTP